MIIKNILNKIYIHPSCYILLLLSIISAQFQVAIIVSFLLLIHECGHFFTAYFFNWPTERITFYPFGGVSKFTHEINCPLKEELIVLLMGPIMQIVGYIFLKELIYSYNYEELIKTIHYNIIIFNLFPIYPLDGGRIIQVLTCYLTSYNLSFKIIYIISYFFLFILLLSFIYNPTLNILLITTLLIIKLIKEKQKTNYYLEKFTLERYLHKYNFKKSKIVPSPKAFKRDYHHLIKAKNKYYLEEEYLLNKYKNKF